MDNAVKHRAAPATIPDLRMNHRRLFTAPPDDLRCQADRKPLGDGSDARCMRRAAEGKRFCVQHAAVRSRLHCEGCRQGGAECPTEHTCSGAIVGGGDK